MTSDTSGKSSPSLKRFIPTNTSKLPNLKSFKIFTRSSVSTSLWIYFDFISKF